jgi:hypothetical protein
MHSASDSEKPESLSRWCQDCDAAISRAHRAEVVAWVGDRRETRRLDRAAASAIDEHEG